MTLKERMFNELLSRKHPMEEWTDPNGTQVRAFKKFLDESKFKIVVALCIYNEEDTIYETLENCKKIADLDGIHILDGAWKNGLTEQSHTSSDKTSAEIMRWIKDTNNEYKVVIERNPEKTVFESESVKRNYQLDRIHELFGKSYIFVLDGDEKIRFNCGRDNIFLKEHLYHQWPRIVIIKTYSHNGLNGHIGARVIPSGYGIHYHTDKPMVVHSEDHRILCDYNFHYEPSVSKNETYDFDIMFLVNGWNTRAVERVRQKDDYSEWVWDTKREVKDCEYNTVVSTNQ